MWLVLHADTTRVEQLRLVGDRLEERARELLERETPEVANTEDRAAFDIFAARKMAAIRGWAAALDKGRYEYGQLPNGDVQIQPVPPDDVITALQPANDELARGMRATSLITRYASQGRTASIESVAPDELARAISRQRGICSPTPQITASVDPPTGRPPSLPSQLKPRWSTGTSWTQTICFGQHVRCSTSPNRSSDIR